MADDSEKIDLYTTLYPALHSAFSEFVAEYNAYSNRDRGRGRSADQADSEEKVNTKTLVRVLDELKAIGYNKRELTFIFEVESLTFDRWMKGGSLKPETFRVFSKAVRDIIIGRALHPVSAFDAGYVSWRYLFRQRQTQAKKIFYISEGRFLLEKSPQVQRAEDDLFLEDQQDLEGREKPLLIYLYPQGSDAEKSLCDWQDAVENERGIADRFRGTVIGIGIRDGEFSWLQPSTRTVILELPWKDRFGVEYTEVEGYFRTKIANPKMLPGFDMGFEIGMNDQHLPWLRIEQSLAGEWATICNRRFGKLIEEFRTGQEEAGRPFQVHYWPEKPQPESYRKTELSTKADPELQLSYISDSR